MSEIKTYQPWSIPVLHTTLPDILLDELIQLTDLIEKDKDRKSMNESLAGEIEEEWKIDNVLLTNISFKSYIIQLCWKYFNIISSQFYIKNNQVIPQELTFMKLTIENIQIIDAWFNNQKDNEYNPIHNHDGYFSGVLYLKIPEYMPSRKNEYQDGSICFVGNSSSSDDLFTASLFSILPKIGDIFLFPSTLTHQVYPFRTTDGKGIRRSLSYNLDAKLKIQKRFR